MGKLFIVCFIVCANVAACASAPTATLENELRKAFREDGVGALATVQKLFKEAGIDVNAAGPTPEMIAVADHLILIVEELLSLKKPDGSLAVNINQSNADGITPLLAACEIGLYEMIEKLLAVPGIDINQANNNGETPLLVACKRSPYAVSALLAVPGIDVNKADNNGETPLLAVCKNNVGGWFGMKTISVLLKKGATNKANKKGETPLEITKGNFVHDLLEAYLVTGSTANMIRQLVLEEDSEWV
ncbi:MAG TPA: ankyrin repeat domain-containing protein [Candidatus Babeliales bacterium]|nr:ankyrin repeat domain-containing protein [Candidatus Babeliales bacterium]